MKTTSIVTGIKLKTIPSGNNKCFYNHILYFDDGSNGCLKACIDPNPSWLKEGIELEYDLQPGQYGNFIVLIKVDGKPIEEIIVSQNFSKNNQGKQNEHPRTQRIEDIPEYWLKKEKCITMMSVLKSATELVCAGKLELKDLHKCTIKNFNMIMEQSGIK